MHADHTLRVFEIVKIGLVELGVLLVGDLGLATLPDGDHRVDGLDFGDVLVLGDIAVVGIFGFRHLTRLRDLHANGIAHVVAVALDELAQLPLAQVFAVVVLVGIVFQQQDNIGAVRGLVVVGALRDGVARNAVGYPDVHLVASKCAADNLHFLCHHERRVEADAELADDVGGIRAGEVVLVLELLAARMSNGAQVLLELVGVHADARIGHGDRAGILVEADCDFEIALRQLHLAVGQAAEIQLVNGIGRIGNEFAQKDFAVRVNRVDHQIEKLLALCFELTHNGWSLPFSAKNEQWGTSPLPGFSSLSLRVLIRIVVRRS